MDTGRSAPTINDVRHWSSEAIRGVVLAGAKELGRRNDEEADDILAQLSDEAAEIQAREAEEAKGSEE